MKEENNIDEVFRSGIHKDYPVDNSLWSAVESQLPTAPNRKSPWYFSLNGLALAFVLLISATISTDTVRPISSEGMADSERTLIDKGIVSASNETQIEAVESEPITNQNTSKKSLNPLTKTTTNTNESTPKSIEKGKINKKNKTAKKYLSNNKDENTKEESSATIDKKVGRIAPLKTSNSGRESSLRKQYTNSIDSKNNANSESLSLNAAPKSLLELDSKFDFVSLMDPQPMDWNLIGSRSNGNLMPKSANDDRIFKRPLSKQAFMLEFVAMQSFQTEKKISGNDSKLIDFKANSEVSGENTRIGVNLIRPFRFLTFGAGVHYVVQSEKVRYKVNREELGFDISYDTTYRVVNSNFMSNGNPVLLIEKQINETQTPTFTLVEDYLYRTNTFRRIQVPIFIGFNKKQGNWMAEVRGAFVTNYLFDQQGAYISSDLKTTKDFSESGQFNTMVYSYQFNASLGYQINELIGVGLRYGYEQDITSFTKEYDSKWSNQRAGVWLLYQPNW